ncbi:MAG TPA: cyclic nucleotide-binding domain-containing protein [Solirubrobacteraceae bacterium]|nr:cyclic nucleotide-binding domain-containing protein [Solirubrobacteraceae bacterium]
MQRRRIGRDGVERLGRIEALRDLSVGQRRMLAEIVDETTAEVGETLIRQGDPGYEFLMLEEGSAEVVQDGERINVMGPGDFFGELAVLEDGLPRTASVIAVTDLRAIVFTAHFMREMRERMPAVGEQIDRAAAERRERDLRTRS